ncbi:MAG: PorV/PorQ family protein [candidate division Zixibacteria bacterium]|nr:PorV/PorQ family protein [Candidatus Tariuqbacter arcticus]
MRKLWVLILLIPVTAFSSEFAKVGTVGAQFKKIGIGARGAAMGGAYEAVSNDITAVFWNPSGLVNIDQTSVFVSHINWLADIGYDALAVAKYFPGIGVFAFSVSYMNSGDIERTTVENPDGGIGDFSTDHMMAGITYARRLTDKFSFGANLKFVRERLDDQSSNAWATDLGIQYYTGFHSLRLGMSIRNFGPEIQLSGDYWDLDNGVPLSEPTEYLPFHFPMTFKLGAAMELYDSEQSRFTVAADIVHPNDNVERINAGAEAMMWNKICFRGGYCFEHDTAGPSFGVGFLWQKLTVNYSYSDFGVLDWVQRFDFIFNM